MLMFENRSRSRKGGVQGSIAQVSFSLFFLFTQPKLSSHKTLSSTSFFFFFLFGPGNAEWLSPHEREKKRGR